MVKRADEMSHANEARKYSYEKRSHTEELDAAGKIIKATDKLYEVVPINGVPFSRLTQIQNRNLTEEEIQQQKRKEEEFRQRVKGAHGKGRFKREEDILNPSLIDHYDFRVERRERVDDRSALALSFHPKRDHQAEKTVEDKVLNRLAGMVWVDEKEAEVIRVQVGLTEDLSLGWFGMVGSLKRFDFKMERQRLADGVWVDKDQTAELSGRKVLTPMHFRSLEEFFNFRRP
jgi:hypothetical protein